MILYNWESNFIYSNCNIIRWDFKMIKKNVFQFMQKFFTSSWLLDEIVFAFMSKVVDWLVFVRHRQTEEPKDDEGPGKKKRKKKKKAKGGANDAAAEPQSPAVPLRPPKFEVCSLFSWSFWFSLHARRFFHFCSGWTWVSWFGSRFERSWDVHNQQ